MTLLAVRAGLAFRLAQQLQGRNPLACRQDAHFIDPLMDVKTPEEIALAFYSLVKTFTKVEVSETSAELIESPTLPKHLQSGQYQQVQWPLSVAEFVSILSLSL